MLSRRFFISWIIASVLMYAASYFWHGVFLNDFSRLGYPKEIFLVAAAFVYLLIGFIVNKVYDSRLFDRLESTPILKGILVGAICGFVIYLVCLVVGVSFSSQMNMKNMVLDISWQVVEQAIGGLSVGLVHFYIAGRIPFKLD